MVLLEAVTANHALVGRKFCCTQEPFNNVALELYEWFCHAAFCAVLVLFGDGSSLYQINYGVKAHG